MKKNNKKLNVVLSGENCLEDDIVNNYSNKYIGKIFEKYKNNCIIFNKEYREKDERVLDNVTDYNDYLTFEKDLEYKEELIKEYEKYGLYISFETMSHNQYKEFIKYDRRLNVIKNKFNLMIYKNSIEKWINKYENNIIHQQKTIVNEINGEKIITSIMYYIEITEDLKKDILSRSSIYDWCYPLSIEDISFYKDGYCWLYSVAHEEILDIFCKDEKEYEYLKSIGVEFEKNKFIPPDKEELIYKNYEDSKNSVNYF